MLVSVANITLIKDLTGKFDKENMPEFKTMGDETLKIQSETETDYRKVRDLLNQGKIVYFTHQLKSERPYRVVLRGLHPQTDISEIKNALGEYNHDVREVVNVVIKKKTDPAKPNSEKIAVPLPLFFVSLEPKDNNKEIYDLKVLLYHRITVEAPHKRKDIPQCKNCQLFGHTRAYCKNTPKCVKCGESHLKPACQKPNKTKAKCANCAGNHTANWKGCKVYQAAQQKSSPKVPTAVDRIKGNFKPSSDSSFYAAIAHQQPPSITTPQVPLQPTPASGSDSQISTICQILQNIQSGIEKMELRLQRLEKAQNHPSR